MWTTAFALGQAGAAYGSYLFAQTGSAYTLLFALGAAALAFALAIDLAGSRRFSSSSCADRRPG